MNLKPLEEINSGVGSHSLEVPIEKQRTFFADKRMPTEIVTEELGTYFMNNGVTVPEANMIVTPGNSGMLHCLYLHHLSVARKSC